MNRISKALFVFAVALAASGCASSPTVETSLEQPVEPPEEIHPEVSKLLMNESTPFVVRIRPDRLSSVQGYFDDFSEVIVVNRWQRRAFDAIATADDPLRAIFDGLDVANVEDVDSARSVWMTAGVVDADEAVRAANSGLPWLTESMDPTAKFVRVIVPVQDPTAAAERFEARVQKRIEEKAALAAERAAEFEVVQIGSTDQPEEPTLVERSRVSALERHIQIDVIHLGDPRNQSVTQDLWDKLDTSGASMPETSAMRTFLQRNAPVSLYARTSRLRRFGAALMLFEAGQAIRTATPENAQQIRAKGAANLLNLYMAAPASQREFKDVALIGVPAGSSGLGVDLVATRTLVGRQIYDELYADVSLPVLSTEAVPEQRLLADWTWQGNLVDATALLDGVGPDDKLTRDEFLGGAVSIRQIMSFLQRLRWAAKDMGIWSRVGIAHSPTYLPRLGVSQLGEDLRALLPVAMRVRLGEPAGDEPGDDEQASAPVEGAMVVRFDASVDALGGVLERHHETVEQARDAGVSYRIVAGPDGGAELHVAVGQPLDDLVLSERKPVPRGISVDVGEGDTSSPENSLLGAVPVSGPWHVRAAHSPSVARWLLVSGAPAATPEPLEARGELAKNPPPCLDRVIREAMDVFEGMEGMSLPPTIAEVEEALASYDAAAEACAKKAPEHAEKMRWVTGRARWFHAHRPMRYVLTGTAKAVESCKAGHDWGCDRLERRWEEGDFESQLERTHRVVTTLLEDACERGDEVACAQKEEIPAVEELTWRHGDAE